MTDALRTLRRRPDTVERVVVILPGYGDRPEKFIDRVDRIDPQHEWFVVALEPLRHHDAGPHWYEVGDDGPDPTQLADAIDAVARSLDAIALDSGIDRSRFVLVGFSQGGALALACLLDPTFGDAPLAVGALAAYLPHRDEHELPRADGVPVLLAHGTDDPVVESLRGRAAAKALHRAHAVVSWHEVEAEHRFDGELLVELRNWLAALADGGRPHHPPI